MDVHLGCLNNNEKLFCLQSHDDTQAIDNNQLGECENIFSLHAPAREGHESPLITRVTLITRHHAQMWNTHLNNPTESQILHTRCVAILKVNL